jgi:hypothetical protein
MTDRSIIITRGTYLRNMPTGHHTPQPIYTAVSAMTSTGARLAALNNE